MILAILRMAFDSLTVNKLRSFLSMLGIIIGVGAVIAIVSVGSGARSQVTNQISQLGSNLITISPGIRRGSGGRISFTATDVFTMELAEQILQNCPSVGRIMPNVQTSGLLIAGNANYQTQVVGVTPVYQQIYDFYPARGQFITEAHEANATNVMVLGSGLAKELFPNTDPLGQTVKLFVRNRHLLFVVVGVMEEKGTGAWGNIENQAFIPASVLMKKINNRKYVNGYTAQAVSAAAAKAAVGEIEYFLTRYLGGADKFRITSQEQLLETISQVTGTLSLMLGGIAGISLLVGGIGIMNIMLVSVTERTREIGIRKALGAKRRHILAQFIIEALTMSGLGGLLGIGLGWLGAAGVARIGGWPLVVTHTSVLVAFSFSLLVGLFFGIYPARKASKLDPVIALSYE
ncbi:ABC transporter permease [Capillibacterium thermochitinicola]|uniref:ABC transporter permease n=1 Tax=Capillibacterium thermochitinicola TaxID=2699427 RepID=A0A8J6HYM1_9FIRM|nr:ABC transporter permease [Capillibacterium thermochitinicola]MBA2132270.1 ABC transporter permease [Capillibacterium thermochitinicola]